MAGGIRGITETDVNLFFVPPRVVPVRTAGCYVPGGLYGYTVSAVMTAGVARAAGVSNIICSAPTNKKTGKIHPNTLYAMKTAGATQILALGGVQVPHLTSPCVDIQLAGYCSPRLRSVHWGRGGHHRGSGEQVRGRGQETTVWSGGNRSDRGTN